MMDESAFILDGSEAIGGKKEGWKKGERASERASEACGWVLYIGSLFGSDPRKQKACGQGEGGYCRA